jgi:Flp pilus assembly protein TadD
VSRLADLLMGMDEVRARRPGLGGIPSLGESAEPRRQWRIVVTLVILVMMGAFAVAVTLRPHSSGLSSLRAAATTPVPGLPSRASIAPLAAPAPPAMSARDRVAALMRTGVDAATSGDTPEAAAAFRKAAEIDPTNALAWSSLGVVLVRAGDETAGIEAFRRALRAAPGHPETHRNLAVVLDRQGRGAEAARHYRAFLATAPADSPDRPTIVARLEELAARRVGE